MEKDLFGPIKEYFEAQGYTVDGEVADIDMYMEKGEETIAVELKQNLDFRAVQQAALRQKVVDKAYIGIFKPKNMNSATFRDKVYLLKRLGIGLIVVSKRAKLVNLVNEPIVTEITKFQSYNKTKKEKISKEFNKRKAKNNIGGVRGTKLISSYREEALLVLDALAELGGEANTKDIKKLSGIEKSTQILKANYYGWFENISRGIYKIMPAGYNALEEFEEAMYILKRGRD